MFRGRRGDTSLVFEVIFSIVGFLAFALAAFLHINNATDGTEYFSEVYSSEFTSLAELATAGQGEVFLRFDNLKPLEVDATFTDSNIRIGRFERHYGLEQEYVFPEAFDILPQTMFFRKTASAFTITDSRDIIETCSLVRPAIDARDATFMVQIEGAVTDREKEEMVNTFFANIPYENVQNGVFSINIELLKGSENSISIDASNKEMGVFGCHFREAITTLSLIDFVHSTREQSDGQYALSIRITTTNTQTIDPIHVGLALEQALGGFYG
jgi:hypothetical protein